MKLRHWPAVVAGVFWVATLLTLFLRSRLPEFGIGWDFTIYKTAMASLQAGRDPYLDGTALQKIFHATTHASNAIPAYSYVYAPVTIPILRLIAKLSFHHGWIIYFLLYVASILAGIRLLQGLAKPDEKAFIYLASPATLFFPGLLENENIFSGNIAYILYGAILISTYYAWRSGKWRWFYPAVVVAACVKLPMLTLLAIPCLTARKQWLPAAATAIFSLALFGSQAIVAPALFSHYLEAVNLQFKFNRDFGASPAGQLAELLFNKVPYSVVSLSVYGLTLCVVVPLLLQVSQKFKQGRLLLADAAPVLLVGVILLNPRIMEYDVAPITLPLALIFYRVYKSLEQRWLFVLPLAAWITLNIVAMLHWKKSACILLCCLFAAAVKIVLSQQPDSSQTTNQLQQA